LHVRTDEVLGVLLEHVVDLVQDRVDVLAELLPTFLTGRPAACIGIVVSRLPTGTDNFADHPADDRDSP